MEESLQQRLNLTETSSETSTSSHGEQVYQLYKNQVGGHHTILCPKSCNDYIIKPAIKKELQFYEQMQQNRKDNKLAQFLPKFYGTTEITQSTKIIIQDALQSSNAKKDGQEINSTDMQNKMMWLQNLYKQKHFFGRSLKLQNLTKDYDYPCVLDIKMGFTAPSEKHVKKFESTTSSTHGFRICGLNVFWSKVKKTVFKDKYWGRQITQDNLNFSMAHYFYDGEKIRKDIIKKFVDQLLQLKEALEIYKGFHFKSSSLLMIYNGEKSKDYVNNNNNNDLSLNKQSSSMDMPVVLKLIDFANIEYMNSNRTDNELIDGVINLIDCLQCISSWENFNIDINGQVPVIKKPSQSEVCVISNIQPVVQSQEKDSEV